MPTYEIEQYEIHAQKFQVEADSEAEAVKKLMDGEAEATDDGLQYIEVCSTMGVPISEHQELADDLIELKLLSVHDHNAGIIPSIRTIEEISDDT